MNTDSPGDIKKACQSLESIKGELFELEEYINDIWQFCPIPLVYLNVFGAIIDVSESFEKMLGYRKEDVIGGTLVRYFKDESDLKRLQQITLEQGGVKNLECILLNQVGEEVYANISTLLRSDEQGNPVGYFLAFSDITEEKRAELKFRNIFDNAGDAIFIHDLEGNFLAVNKTACEWLGYSQDEILKLRPEDIDVEHSCEKCLKKIEEVKKKGHIFFETGHCTKDGRVIPVELSVRIITYDNETAVLAIARDISLRKQAEEALKESEKKFRILAEESPNMIFINQAGRIVYANKSCEKVTGYTREEFYADDFDFYRLFDPESGERWRRNFEKYMNNEEVEPIEYTLVTKNENKIETLITTRLIKYGGEPSILGIVTDITQQKRVEQDLKQSYKELKKTTSSFVFTMAKIVEVRDPYTAGHQQRVAKLAVAIAQKLGLSEQEIDTIEMAALIHDIGKLYVPAELLNRPGKLTETEMGLIRTHPSAGFDIAKTIEFPGPIAQIILQHHERMDGTGYPGGLQDDEILLAARILAVADVVEAMMSHRPYRPAHSLDETIDEIATRRAVYYDAQVVDACIELFKKKLFMF